MNTDQLVSLFQSVNRGTVSLVDSLSVLSAVSELNDVKVEIDLHSGMLRVLLENLDIERAALFLRQGDHLELVTTAIWGSTDIISRHRQDEWREYDVSLNESAVGKAAISKKIRYQKCPQLPGFFTPVVNKEDHNDVIGIRTKANALMYVPLVSQDNVLGVLCLHYNLNEAVLSTLDQFFPLFARFYVQTLMNFRYMHDLQGQVKERTQQLEEALQDSRQQHDSDNSGVLADEVTGLPNRRFFCAESLSALARAARYKRAFSCCVIEIKKGYDVSVLEALADILKMQVRESDILAHLRDRQFILSLPEVDAEGVYLFAQRILAVLEELAESVDLFDAIELQIGLSSLNDEMSGSTESVLDKLMSLAGQAIRLGADRGRCIYHIDDSRDLDQEMARLSL